MIGLNRLRAPRKRAILNFHGVGLSPRSLDAGERAVWLDEAQFVRFLEEIARQDDCEITFDDGNKSDVDVVLPLLLSHGLKATFFVLAGRIGAPFYLNAQDLRKLLGAGMEIGLHGYDHKRWRGMSSSDLFREVDESKAVLEEVSGHLVTKAAIPFGDYGRVALTQLRNSGIKFVYTSDGGLAIESRWLQPRRTITCVDDPSLVRRMFAEPLPTRVFRRAKILIKTLR